MTKKNISLTDFEGNPNIGIYMFANDKFCLIGPKIKKEKQKEIEKTLNVPAYNLTILETELIGVFLTGNNEILLAPPMQKYEEEKLQKICKKHNTKLIIINNKLNTYGNNICISNNKILYNANYEPNFPKELKKQTNLQTIPISSKQFNSAGSTIKNLNNKFFISQEYTEKEVQKILDEIAGSGTINKGSNYISSGMIGNKHGIILGSQSTSVEIQNVLESLEYI